MDILWLKVNPILPNLIFKGSLWQKKRKSFLTLPCHLHQKFLRSNQYLQPNLKLNLKMSHCWSTIQHTRERGGGDHNLPLKVCMRKKQSVLETPNDHAVGPMAGTEVLSSSKQSQTYLSPNILYDLHLPTTCRKGTTQCTQYPISYFSFDKLSP